MGEGSRRLWIGGSSGLARTYFNTHGTGEDEWILLGHTEQAPDWVAQKIANDSRNHHATTSYVCLDLLQFTDAQLEQVVKSCQNVQDVIVGIRPVLVSPQSLAQAWQTNAQMLKGLQRLLQALVLPTTTTKVERILHVSSIAAIHHVQRQCLRSETSHRDPRSDELDNPYDRFKRATEELVLQLGDDRPSLQVTNVRLGAIFSDDSHCIQCNALGLQSRCAVYLNVRIDCNSSYNVALLLSHLLLWNAKPWRPVYYYTRPVHYKEPVEYGYYLRAYQEAYNITWAKFYVPLWLVTVFVWMVHLIATRWASAAAASSKQSVWSVAVKWSYDVVGCQLLCLPHVDYLLQVTRNEHTFDLTAVAKDFPKLAEQEESLVECFARRRRRLREYRR